MPIDYQPLWETYVCAWKAASAADQRALLAASAAPDCRYQDPLADVCGHDALVAYMQQFHQQVPGGHFVTRRFRCHHQHSVAEWDMLDAHGHVIGDGISVGHYNDAGQLVAIAGFFDS